MEGNNRTVYIVIAVVFIVLAGIIIYLESTELSAEDMDATVDARVAAILTDADFESTNQAQIDSVNATGEARETEYVIEFNSTIESQRESILTDVALANPTATITITPSPTATIPACISNDEYELQQIFGISTPFALSNITNEVFGVSGTNVVAVSIETGETRQIVPIGDSITLIDVSVDSQYLAVATENNSVFVYDLNTNERIAVTGASNGIELAWSSDSQYLAGVFGSDFRVFAMPDLELVVESAFGVLDDEVPSLNWIADTHILAGVRRGGIYTVDLDSDNPRLVGIPDTDEVVTIDISPDGSQIVALDRAVLRNLTLINRLSGEVEGTVGQPVNSVQNLAWSPNQSDLAISLTNSSIHIWNFETQEVGVILEHTDPVTFMEWSLDGQYLLTYSNCLVYWELSGTDSGDDN